MSARLGRCLLAIMLLAAYGAVSAAGLQVAPISLNVPANQTAEGLWLSNTGDSTLHAQVRVFRWTQADGKDQLTPSRGLVISPPMVELATGKRQLVRVIRVGAPPSGSTATEDAYRVLVDELPIDTAKGQGLQFVLRYSVPVFVAPIGKVAVTPHLTWSLQQENGHAALTVSNNGTGHAQLSQLSFTDRAGKKTQISAGLLGYVLPGARMQWTLKAPAQVFTGGGTLNARINGETVTQPLSLDAASR